MRQRQIARNIIRDNTLNELTASKKAASIFSKFALCFQLFAAFLLVFCARAADIPDSHLYSIVTNPGEDSSAQMNIGWHSNTNLTNSFVTYTKKSDASWVHVTNAKGACQISSVFNGISSKTASGADFTETAVFFDWGGNIDKPGTGY